MYSQTLNSIGLLLDIVGASMLFKYGFPQPNFEEGVGLGLGLANVLENGKTVAQHNEEVRVMKGIYFFRSRLAMVLIIFGFLFQLVATWVPV
jgi:hypothetical protein